MGPRSPENHILIVLVRDAQAGPHYMHLFFQVFPAVLKMGHHTRSTTVAGVIAFNHAFYSCGVSAAPPWPSQWVCFPVAEGTGAICFTACSVASTESLCHMGLGPAYSPRHREVFQPRAASLRRGHPLASMTLATVLNPSGSQSHLRDWHKPAFNKTFLSLG